MILRRVMVGPYRPRFSLELEFEFTPEVEVGPSRCPRSDQFEVELEFEPDVRRTNQLPINVQSV